MLELSHLEPLVLTMCEKYRYEEQHCHRVAGLAQQLFDLLKPLHGLGEHEALLLRHAALLHDIGHFVNYRGHHRHSAYLIRRDSALSGYGEERLEIVANIALNHRKKPSPPPDTLDRKGARGALQLSAMLRLVDGMDHDRSGTAAILGTELSDEQIRLQVTGLNLTDLADVLKKKVVLIKPAFERKLVWVPATEPLAEARRQETE